MARVIFTQNDARARFLLEAFRSAGHDVFEVAFDQIDPLTKAMAAVLTVNSPKSEWWESYQNHPLVQARRTRVFRTGAKQVPHPIDAVVSWGSWFCPSVFLSAGKAVPYTYYIDQSRSIEPESGEARGLFPRPRSGNQQQGFGYRSARAVNCMSHWAVGQSRRAHPTVDGQVFRWAGWGPCSFDDSTRLEIAEKEEVVLLVANDFHRKGVDWFVETAKIVRATRPSCRFMLIGKDQSGLKIDFPDYVEYLGPIYEKDRLLQYFRTASVFFLPNRFDRSPHVLVEAMSTGLPIVVSDQGGASELVSDGQVGGMANPGDIAGYAAHILRYLTNRDEAISAGLEGRRRVRETYNWSAVARRVLASVLPSEKQAS